MFDDLRLTRRDAPVPRHADGRPVSATVSWINFTGLAAFLAGLVLIHTYRFDQTLTLMALVAAIALPVIVLEVVFVNGLPQRIAPPGTPLLTRRTGIKCMGLAVTIAAVGTAYWLFPVYRAGDSRVLLDIVTMPMVWVPFVLLAPFYIGWMDQRMVEPDDGYYHAGLAALGSWQAADRVSLWQHALAWVVKGFFLPLMLLFAMTNLVWWQEIWWADFFPPGLDTWGYLTGPAFFQMYELTFRMAFFVDVAFACAGYMLTLKVFDSQIRSTEPTWFGWIVCIACYPPFWSGALGSTYFAYDADGLTWMNWFGHYPVIARIWAVALLALVLVYAWATVQFGIRFSNLTNRGILTNGPFRWTKHPAYISKNLSWWMIAVPFLSDAGTGEAIRLSLLLAGVNLIYFLRAKTEERHLMHDPTYRAYAAWMEEHAALAVARHWVARHLPAIANGGRRA